MVQLQAANDLDAIDLYFNTSGQLKVYSGTAWQNAAPSTSDQTNINTLAAISADVTSLANAIRVNHLCGHSSKCVLYRWCS